MGVKQPFVVLKEVTRDRGPRSLAAKVEPMLVHRGWLHGLHPDGQWVTCEQLTDEEIELYSAHAIPHDQAVLYGPLWLWRGSDG